MPDRDTFSVHLGLAAGLFGILVIVLPAALAVLQGFRP